MYYDSNKISYHLPTSSVSVQDNKSYSVQQSSSSISILVAALDFVIASHSQTNSFISFYSACHLVSFTHHERSPLIALIPIHLFIKCLHAKFEASNPSNSHFTQYLSWFCVAAHPNGSNFLLFFCVL